MRSQRIAITLTCAILLAGLVTQTDASQKTRRSQRKAAPAKSFLAKKSQDGVWTEVDVSKLRFTLSEAANLGPLPTSFRAFRLNHNQLNSILRRAPHELTDASLQISTILSIPLPDGTFMRFRLEESPILEPELAAQVPTVKTYAGRSIDDQTATMRLTSSPSGVSAIILSTRGTFHIQPLREMDPSIYVSFSRGSAPQENEPFQCLVTERNSSHKQRQKPLSIFVAPYGGTLRQYRVAIAATGEYTNHFRQRGDNDEQAKRRALNQIIAVIDQINAIYQHEFAVRLRLVGKELDIIFPNPDTDPYNPIDTDGRIDIDLLLPQNQTTLKNKIGVNNYDIGHLFGTWRNGVAATQSVCDNTNDRNKARAYTGRADPTGPGFIVGYVAHEMGHQFGANHTQFGCRNQNWENLSASPPIVGTTYEPGSGSTIMGYAADPPICTDWVELLSDSYFHAINLNEITDYITNTDEGWGGACTTSSSDGNHAPTLDAIQPAMIPQNTPFVLTAIGHDEDKDKLTYCWEQYDKGKNKSGVRLSDFDPLFRSRRPEASGSRMFPRLTDIVAKTPNSKSYETLPTKSGKMNFRVTVRDERGGFDFGNVTITVVADSSAFEVTQPSTGTDWKIGTTQTITWQVANTTIAPINCTNVRIVLLTLDVNNNLVKREVLLVSTPNDGTEMITVPNIPTAKARIAVEAVGNIFFAVSPKDFAIVP